MLGIYPAVDVLESVSRLFTEVSPASQVAEARELLAAMSLYRENEDLIQIGAYQPGSSAEIDRAIALRAHWIEYLRQDRSAASSLAESRRRLSAVLAAS
jgi:flagellum-specific ATP synthase